MATREVKVGLRADVTPYISAIQAAERATTRWADRAVADAARAQNALGGVRPPGGGPGPAGPAPRPPGTPAGDPAAAARARVEEQRLAKQADAMDKVGTAATGMGAAVAGGFLMSAKAAIDWETAWAGVTKTVNGTTEEMAGLEGQLRSMAKNLPASHAEIAGVAEAAGQLGVKREDIASFTKTMIDLGVSTNLSAQDAATSIAQMTNVMGTAPKDVGRLGAALVALGNAGASTESDIMSMAARLSGAGKLVGASESGILAMANAMASVGIESELGGGSMSRTLTKIYTAVKSGGPALESFAKTAGMTAQEFADAFAADPMRAISAFVGGLARIKDSGGNVVAALGDVKIKGTQDLQVLLRLAGAGDLLNESLDLGAQAWQNNTALTNEASKRYDTVASKLKVARNNLYDLAIQIGDVLLPVIAKMADGVSGAIDLFEKMPGPVREVAVVLGALGGGTLLFGGALLLTLPRIAATRAAIATLAGSTMWLRITTNLRFLSIAMSGLMATAGGPWVAAFVAAAAVIGTLLLMNRKSKPPIDDLTAAIKADTGALGANTKAAVANRLQKQGALDLADKYGISLVDLTDATLGNADAQERVNAAINAARAPYEARISQLRETAARTDDVAAAARAQSELSHLYTTGAIADLGKLDSALGSNSDDTKRATAESEQLARASATTGAAAADQASREEQLNRALGRSAAKAAAAAGGAKKLGGDVQALGDKASAAKDDIKALTDTIQALFDQAFAAGRANDAYAKGINDLVDQVKSAIEAGDRHATSLRGNSDAALANREAIRSQVEATKDIIVEYTKEGHSAEDVGAKTRALKKDLEDQAAAAGLSRGEVRTLTRVLDDLPQEISILLGVDTASAVHAVDRIQAMIDDLHGKNIPITFSSTGSVRSPGGGEYQVGGRTMAEGGIVRGPGGPRDDAIPAWLSDGEFIVNAAATARHRPLLEHVNARGYAAGGAVGSADRALALTERRLAALEKSLDKLTAAVQGNVLGEGEVHKYAREFAAGIKAQFVGSANITGLPNVGGTGASQIRDLQAQLDRATAFTAAMARLRKAGLNETALSQMREAGAEGGGLAAAEQLLNGGSISQVNKLMGKIAKVGGDFAAAERRRMFAAAEKDEARLLARKARLTRRQVEQEHAAEAAKDAKAGAKATTTSRATRTTSTGRTLSAVSSGATLTPVVVKVTFDVTGAEKHMAALVRHMVRIYGGGNVQKAFGT